MQQKIRRTKERKEEENYGGTPYSALSQVHRMAEEGSQEKNQAQARQEEKASSARMKRKAAGK